MGKITKRERFVEIAEILAGVGADNLVEFVENEIDLIDRRASKPRKPTKTQLENEALKAEIVDILGNVDEGRTATEVANTVGVSVQKASQLLRQLVAENAVTRVEGKGKTKTVFTR